MNFEQDNDGTDFDHPVLHDLVQVSIERLKNRDLDPEEESNIAAEFWQIEMNECIVMEDMESAWQRIRAAAIGSRIFEGPNRARRPALEGLPVGIVCAPQTIMGMVHVLYYEMSKRGLFLTPLDTHRDFPSWVVDSSSGKSVELMQPGNRVAHIMYRQHHIHFYIAGLQAMAIGEWTANHRRYNASAT